jgi:hypothetical protein
MEFFGEWAFLIIALLAFADAEAGIVCAAIYAGARMLGTADAALAAAAGSALYALLLAAAGSFFGMFRSGPRIDTIDRWEKRAGALGAAAAARLCLARRFAAPAQAGSSLPRALALCAFYALWAAFWTVPLAWLAETIFVESEYLIRARMTIAGLTLLAAVSGTVIRTALVRYYERFKERHHENSGR